MLSVGDAPHPREASAHLSLRPATQNIHSNQVAGLVSVVKGARTGARGGQGTKTHGGSQ